MSKAPLDNSAHTLDPFVGKTVDPIEREAVAEISRLTARVEELERALIGVVDCLTVYVKKEAEHPYCDPLATIRGVNELGAARTALGTAGRVKP